MEKIGENNKQKHDTFVLSNRESYWKYNNIFFIYPNNPSLVKFSGDLHLFKVHIFDRVVFHINNVWYTAHGEKQTYYVIERNSSISFYVLFSFG